MFKGNLRSCVIIKQWISSSWFELFICFRSTILLRKQSKLFSILRRSGTIRLLFMTYCMITIVFFDLCIRSQKAVHRQSR